MYEGLAAALVVAVASVIVAVIQGRKTRQTNTREHNENARRIRKIGKRIGKIDRALEQHLEEHRRNP